MKRRILLVLENDPYGPPGGIERHCANLMEMFRSDDSLEVDYVSTDRIAHRYSKVSGKVVWDPKELRTKIEQADTVHVHGFASYTVGQALKIATRLRKKVIYTPHFHPFDSLRRPLLGKLFFGVFVRPHLSKVDMVVAINNEDRAFFERFAPRVVLIPNWLTGLQTVVTDRAREMILAVGRNDDNKALWHLNGIDFDRYTVHCVTGNGEGLDRRIVVHNHCSDHELATLYAQASLVVVPSKYEAFSYVALEALERGTPVLLSDRVRIADHLQGVSGVGVFAYADTQAFAEGIERTIGCSVDAQMIKERFSAESVKEQLKSLYDGAI